MKKTPGGTEKGEGGEGAGRKTNRGKTGRRSHKKEIVREKTEKGKKVKLTYDFVLEGWSFNDFYELSRASGFKILFISPFKGVEEKNYEVTGIDRQGRLVVQMQPLDENNYSKKGCMVVDIPAEGQDSWRITKPISASN